MLILITNVDHYTCSCYHVLSLKSDFNFLMRSPSTQGDWKFTNLAYSTSGRGTHINVLVIITTIIIITTVSSHIMITTISSGSIINYLIIRSQPKTQSHPSREAWEPSPLPKIRLGRHTDDSK